MATLLVLPAQVFADISRCHDLTGSRDRLACYDEETRFEIVEDLEDKRDDTAEQKWVVKTETSALDGRDDVWLSVQSENTQPDQIGRPAHARLYLRCMNDTTNVFLTFNSFTTEDQDVRFRLDDAPVRSVQMEVMNGGDGIGIWPGGLAIAFIRRLFEKERFVVAYRSYSNHNLEFSFDISGLKDRISPLAESCGWMP